MKRFCPQCERNRDEKFFSGPKGRVCATCRKKTTRRSARSSHLWRTFGITIDEYDAMLAFQGGACAVCRGTRPYNLAVDHSHARVFTHDLRRSIRGLLCKRCNKMLRDVRDDIAILQTSVRYLSDPPAQHVLT